MVTKKFSWLCESRLCRYHWVPHACYGTRSSFLGLSSENFIKSNSRKKQKEVQNEKGDISIEVIWLRGSYAKRFPNWNRPWKGDWKSTIDFCCSCNSIDSRRQKRIWPFSSNASKKNSG